MAPCWEISCYPCTYDWRYKEQDWRYKEQDENLAAIITAKCLKNTTVGCDATKHRSAQRVQYQDTQEKENLHGFYKQIIIAST